ncbi:hypothetical protein HanRHA438_Chr15g0713651 [Helianthus annuus]|uniref:Uncharacterized protein n=1 Tax=Helianthus annuus TaxID=4232 RepID=A0A251T8K0_HELAN|nr:hypothetical protein HanXRQr2_Chr15g0701411 [Helianthus annuus]KAJ0451793.1 hypothetical protein HanHA300_Chr15g0571631 [Helianthus annuus]KAJ0456470.1 hypothetical protein HanIR_Chr15g0762841 [Helianthus annuus]KAJ0473682.1 hypothetical protein HanHA89_Chr15g0621151 [Helianthus annuus]KAJ0649259.1 hypothetical protein HanLR1_Chr15g0582251 [Helianthus annuus]
MKYNSLKHNTFIPYQQHPFYPNPYPPHPIFGRPTKPKKFISNFKSRALFHFRFLSPSKIWICSSFLLSLSFKFSLDLQVLPFSGSRDVDGGVTEEVRKQLWWNP